MRAPDVIATDKLGKVLTDLIRTYQPKTILEIGSSDGRGSTSVIYKEARKYPCKMYCIEMNRERFADLEKLFGMNEWMELFCGSSVDHTWMIPTSIIKELHKDHPEFNVWNELGLDYMIKWHEQTVTNINNADHCFKLLPVDFAFVDGSPFTGYAEADLIYGTKIIVLDDVMDLKCFFAYNQLKESSHYKLIDEDLTFRNGYAVFSYVERI